MKTLKELTLLDRFLFAEAIEDPETMELILEVILGREIIPIIFLRLRRNRGDFCGASR